MDKEDLCEKVLSIARQTYPSDETTLSFDDLAAIYSKLDPEIAEDDVAAVFRELAVVDLRGFVRYMVGTGEGTGADGVDLTESTNQRPVNRDAIREIAATLAVEGIVGAGYDRDAIRAGRQERMRIEACWIEQEEQLQLQQQQPQQPHELASTVQSSHDQSFDPAGRESARKS